MKKTPSKEISPVVEQVRTETYSSKTEPPGKWVAAIEEANDRFLHENFIVCRECGAKLWILTEDHIARHGLTLAEYRERHGYDSSTPLQCRSLSRIFALLA